MDNIGIFDDICLRFKTKTLDKPLAVFIQAKHRENDTLLKNDWATYFDSYMKIKQAFKPTNTDLIFKGQYDEIECFFVIYTTAKGDNNYETFESPYASSLNDIIGTTQDGQQTTVKYKDVEYLYKIIIKEQVIQLAKPIAKLFFDEITDYQMFMNNEHVFIYHVILAQRFCKVSDIQIGNYRLAQVRPEFFDTEDENIMTFRSSLYKELIEKRRVRDDSEFKTLVTLFFDNPTDVLILSKVIGCVITHKNDESVEKGFLELNGGIASAVGNLLVLDDYSKMLKFNENIQELGDVAKREGADMLNYDTVNNMYIGRRVCRNKKRELPVMRIKTEDDILIRLKHLQYTTCTAQIMQKCSDSLQSKPDEQQQERLHIDTLHDIDDDVVTVLVGYEILASVAELFLTSETQKMYKHLELFIGDRKT
ncbi:hypothetical protein PYW08_012705 [Mythimna loreyi]|uniref:Uncharacterized protein n=1 Tax=Mythimna loreyi TaxID=667449 RepID=A0ACC2Q0Z8_9NEOP|nr:hypothetical protein PYW08_012705 [Mythimna loreyi]